MAKKEPAGAKLAHLERIPGVAAVPPGARGVSASPTPHGAGRPNSALPQADTKPFEEAGWAFVETGSVPAPVGSRPVFRDQDGHLKIDSGALNVRFSGKPSTPEINRLLEQHGLLIKRQLGFSPNLFTVAPMGSSSGMDSVATAKSLTTLDQVDYAEPVFIEAMGGRQSGR